MDSADLVVRGTTGQGKRETFGILNEQGKSGISSWAREFYKYFLNFKIMGRDGRVPKFIEFVATLFSRPISGNKFMVNIFGKENLYSHLTRGIVTTASKFSQQLAVA